MSSGSQGLERITEEEKEAIKQYEKEIKTLDNYEDIGNEFEAIFKNFKRNIIYLNAYLRIQELSPMVRKYVTSQTLGRQIEEIVNQLEIENKEALKEIQNKSKIKEEELEELKEEINDLRNSNHNFEDLKAEEIEEKVEAKEKIKDIEYKEEHLDSIISKLERLEKIEAEKIKEDMKKIEENFREGIRKRKQDKIKSLNSRPTVLFEKSVLDKYLKIMNKASRNKLEAGGFFHYELIKENQSIKYIYIKDFYNVPNESVVEKSSYSNDEVKEVKEKVGKDEKIIDTHCHPRYNAEYGPFGACEPSHTEKFESDIGRFIKEEIISAEKDEKITKDEYENFFKESHSIINNKPYEIISCAEIDNPKDQRKTLIQAHRLKTRKKKVEKQEKFKLELLPIWVSKKGEMLSKNAIKEKYPNLHEYNSVIPITSCLDKRSKSYWDLMTSKNIDNFDKCRLSAGRQNSYTVHGVQNSTFKIDELEKVHKMKNNPNPRVKLDSWIWFKQCRRSKTFRKFLGNLSFCDPEKIV